MNKNKRIISLILVILFLVVLIISLNLELNREEKKYEEEIKLEVEYNQNIGIERILSLEGFNEAEVEVKGNELILKNKNNECEIFSAQLIDFQAYSIQKGIEDKTEVRPTAHDIIRDMIEIYEFEILIVKISGYYEGIYYGNLVLKKDDKIVNFDIKPSDAIGVAVRMNEKIYVSNEIFEEMGEKIC